MCATAPRSVECLRIRFDVCVCTSTQLDGGSGSTNVRCYGWAGCRGATISAEVGGKLSVWAHGRTWLGLGGWKLSNADIYCPPDSLPGEAYSLGAECNINLTGGVLSSTHISATEASWNVNINCSELTSSCRYGTGYTELHCGAQYSSSCRIESTDPTGPFTNWQCENSSTDKTCDTCMLPTCTTSPTTEPTPDPTFAPTPAPTHQPSVSPSVEPTQDPTRHPTVDPTKAPSYDPTQEPTDDPTADPTTNPTIC